MSWETICPECGARLDPGEKCDCKKEKSPIDAGTSTGEAVLAKTKVSHTDIFIIAENKRVCQGVCE